MGRFFDWPVRRRQPRQVVPKDMLEPLPDRVDEAELLGGRPRCCLAANGSGIHDGECCPGYRHSVP